MKTSDVVVVGAGLSGLITATTLARAGRRVTVCEAGPVAGGRARSSDHDGFALNFGPRAMYFGELANVCRSLGLPVSGGTPRVAGGSVLYQDTLHPGYASVGTLLRSKLFSLRERASLGMLLGTAQPSPALASRSAADWLADRLPTELARAAAFGLLRISCYAGHPALISADAVAAQLKIVRPGVRYVNGGWQSIVDALLADVTARGVDVRTGARVSRVESGARVTFADDTTLTARAVVVAGLSPPQAAAVLDRPELDADRIELRTACLDVALSRLPDQRHTFVYGIDEPVYLAVHSDAARVAPDGGAVIHVARYDDGADVEPARVRKTLEALLDRCQPGWRSLVVRMRFLPKMTTMWSVPRAETGGLRGRPDVAAPDAPGIFVAGDWVGPTDILADATAASAVRAARAVQAFLAG
jgi:phytoene dehydrogenase-like protein